MYIFIYILSNISSLFFPAFSILKSIERKSGLDLNHLGEQKPANKTIPFTVHYIMYLTLLLLKREYSALLKVITLKREACYTKENL